jgi:hypothetical protein
VDCFKAGFYVMGTGRKVCFAQQIDSSIPLAIIMVC